MSNTTTLTRPASERSHGARRSRPVSCFTPEIAVAWYWFELPVAVLQHWRRTDRRQYWDYVDEYRAHNVRLLKRRIMQEVREYEAQKAIRPGMIAAFLGDYSEDSGDPEAEGNAVVGAVWGLLFTAIAVAGVWLLLAATGHGQELTHYLSSRGWIK
jgi:hypothetical protein